MDCPTNSVYIKQLDKCELKTVSICDDNPCKSNGVCISDSIKAFHCVCAPGFTGETCEQEMDACFSEPCESASWFGFGKTENKCNLLAPGNPIAYYCECFDGEKFGLKCDSSAEINPCLTKKTKEKLFPTQINKSVYVQCTGSKLVVMPCPASLKFSSLTQRCDW